MRNIIFCGFGLLIFGIPCTAQMFTDLNSLESAIDAEQVAMGESFVAYRAGMMSFKQNPATLTGLKYSTAYYSYRDNEINDSFVNSEFYEFGVTIKNPFGVTNINYARLNLIEFYYMDMNAEIQGKLGIYDEVISLSHGYSLGTNLSLGLSLKWVNFKWYESQVADGDFNYESTPTILGDIGITYFYNGLFKDDNNKRVPVITV